MEKQCTICGKKFESGPNETYSWKCNSCYKKEYYAKPENRDKWNARNKENYQKRKKPKKQRPCELCGKIFETITSNARCCSGECKRILSNNENREKHRIDCYNRYHSDTQRRIAHNIRSRVCRAIKGDYKPGSITKNLECTPEQLMKHLESKFQDGMTWDNYGLHGWHVDHIIPLSSFDLTDPEQFKKACHYTNLQPLWAEDNLKKGDYQGPIDQINIHNPPTDILPSPISSPQTDTPPTPTSEV